jgi:phosphopantothenoylcysteine decarboxylase/phosphopantothenate--cysteine ligase
MSLLYKRKVLLGVSGSIAAYKSAFIVRELIKRGAEVQVVMTHAAKDFITPLTLSTLSKRPVYSEFIEDDQKAYGVWNNHVDMDYGLTLCSLHQPPQTPYQRSQQEHATIY